MTRVLVWIGGGALVFATVINTLGVIGRHVGVPIHGVIELVQVGVLVAGSIALVLATAAGSHAKVNLVLDRLSDTGRRWFQCGALLASAAFFAALLAGSGWIAADLWHAQEVSEVLNIPWQLLRLLAIAALAGALGIVVHHALRRRN